MLSDNFRSHQHIIDAAEHIVRAAPSIAGKRAKVEHVFAGIRHMGGKFIRTIGQARADAAMTLMAACYNIKRLAMFLGTGVDPFYTRLRV